MTGPMKHHGNDRSARLCGFLDKPCDRVPGDFGFIRPNDRVAGQRHGHCLAVRQGEPVGVAKDCSLSCPLTMVLQVSRQLDWDEGILEVGEITSNNHVYV